LAIDLASQAFILQWALTLSVLLQNSVVQIHLQRNNFVYDLININDPVKAVSDVRDKNI